MILQRVFVELSPHFILPNLFFCFGGLGGELIRSDLSNTILFKEVSKLILVSKTLGADAGIRSIHMPTQLKTNRSIALLHQSYSISELIGTFFWGVFLGEGGGLWANVKSVQRYLIKQKVQ